jgi:hypothetical protein
MSPVILMLRTYAFSGRKKYVLALLSIAFFGLAGVIIWVASKELYRLSRRHFSSRAISDTLVELQCRPCSFSSILAAVLPFQIHRVRVNYWRRPTVYKLVFLQCQYPLAITWECVYDFPFGALI